MLEISHTTSSLSLHTDFNRRMFLLRWFRDLREKKGERRNVEQWTQTRLSEGREMEESRLCWNFLNVWNWVRNFRTCQRSSSNSPSIQFLSRESFSFSDRLFLLIFSRPRQRSAVKRGWNKFAKSILGSLVVQFVRVHRPLSKWILLRLQDLF